MILDMHALFSDAQAITGDAASTNSYDLGAPGIAPFNKVQLRRNIGKGVEIPLLIQVVEDFDELTSLTVIVQTDEDVDFGSPKDVLQVVVPLAELVAGFIFPIDKVPRGIVERYLRLYYDVTGTDPNNGAITAGIVGAVDGSYVG